MLGLGLLGGPPLSSSSIPFLPPPPTNPRALLRSEEIKPHRLPLLPRWASRAAWKKPSGSRANPPGRGGSSLPLCHSWLILDHIVHRSRRLHGVVDRDAMTSATSHDCVGWPVRASLRVAAAPAVSHLHLHLPDRDEGVQYLEDMEEPAVVAAHRNSILFVVVVP